MNGLIFVTVMSAALYCNAVPLNDPAYFRGLGHKYDASQCPEQEKQDNYPGYLCGFIGKMFTFSGIQVVFGQEGTNVTASFRNINYTSKEGLHCTLVNVWGKLTSAKVMFTGIQASQLTSNPRKLLFKGRVDYELSEDDLESNESPKRTGQLSFTTSCADNSTGSHLLRSPSVSGSVRGSMELDQVSGKLEFTKMKVEASVSGLEEVTTKLNAFTESSSSSVEEAVTYEGVHEVSQGELLRLNPNLPPLSPNQKNELYKEFNRR